eukprot:TRINITY_DN6633_c0_g1_i2.p1 TRINITY_DN6633_c0_g1~~TRINITY_DN6633_c0_g1_i2.p1  ORF type:complete len:751 (+),score=158.33 TRINITY_DN6633_c0_g1_i2:72-2324(+)
MARNSSKTLIIVNVGDKAHVDATFVPQLLAWTREVASSMEKIGHVGLMWAGSKASRLPYIIDGYEHISIARDFNQGIGSLLPLIDAAEPFGSPCDLYNALLAGVEVFSSSTNSPTDEKRIAYFTGKDDTDLEDDTFSTLTDRMTGMGLKLDVYALTPDDRFPNSEQSCKPFIWTLTRLSHNTSGKQIHRRLPSQSIINRAIDAATKLEPPSDIPMNDAPPVDDVVIPLVHAVQQPQHDYHNSEGASLSASVSQGRSYFRGDLYITNTFSIPIQGFLKTALSKPKSFTRVKRSLESDGNTRATHVIPRHEKVLEEDPLVTVNQADITYAFPYGGKLIPSESIQENLLKVDCIRGIFGVGFVRRELVPRHLFSKTSVVITHTKGSRPAGTMLKAFIHSMHNLNRALIAHFVLRQKSAPSLVILTSYIDEGSEYLVMNWLPYADDLRQHDFPNFNGETCRPTENQAEAAEKLVSGMTLLKEEGQRESYCAHATWNPALDRLASCVMARIQNPKDPLPEVSDEAASVFRHSTSMQQSFSAVWKSFDGAFPALQKDANPKAQVATPPSADDYGDLRIGDHASAQLHDTDDIHALFKDLGQIRYDYIRMNNPIESFRGMLRRTDVDLSKKALIEMSDVVSRIIQESQGSQFFGVAGNCLEALREECIKIQRPSEFNNTLENLKSKRGFDEKTNRFWSLVIVVRKLMPIHKQECPDSKFSFQDAIEFVSPDAASNLDATAPDSDATNDSAALLDLVD